MSAPVPYLLLPGRAAEALQTYRTIFGGALQLSTYAEFGRTDGDGELIAHGELTGPVDISAADVSGPTAAGVTVAGVMFALLGRADAATSRRWFDDLARIGTVIDPLQKRPWGDHDGQVRDRYGITWLIGFHDDPDGDPDGDPEGDAAG